MRFQAKSSNNNSGETSNSFTIDSLEDSFFGGTVIGSELVGKFVGIKEDKAKGKIVELDENVKDGIERVGNKRKDVIHFIFKPRTHKAYFVVESGFQAIGMPKILESMQEAFSVGYGSPIKLSYNIIPKGRANFTFTALKDNVLKRIVWKFKKNFENLPKSAAIFEDVENEVFPKDFEVKLEISIKRTKGLLESLPKIGKYFTKALGFEKPESLEGFDFTTFLEEFKFDYFDTNGNIQQEDILDKYLRSEIEIPARFDPQRIFELLIKEFNTKDEVQNDEPHP